MRIERTIKRLADARDLDDRRVMLRRAARDLGHELPRGRLPLLSEFRTALARLPAAEPFVQGYRDALADVTAAYEAAVTKPLVVSAGDAEPVCYRCHDTHLMDFDGRKVMCTSCPSPCEECRKDGTGAFCQTTPCECDCHG